MIAHRVAASDNLTFSNAELLTIHCLPCLHASQNATSPITWFERIRLSPMFAGETSKGGP